MLGGGRLSTTGWLARELPVAGLPFSCGAVSDPERGVRLRFTVGSGLPPLSVPGLDGRPLDLFTLRSLEFVLADDASVTGVVDLLPMSPAQLAQRVGLPDNVLFEAAAEALAPTGTFSLAAPVDGGDARLELRVAPRRRTAFKLMPAIRALIDAIDPGKTTLRDLPDVPDDFFAVTRVRSCCTRRSASGPRCAPASRRAASCSASRST